MLFSTKYSIDVISRHPQFFNKNLKKYNIDNIETVGAWGNEPFEIKFKNNTNNKVQVKISIDGTDVLTGKPASTEIDKNMWVVNGYSSLALKAWPETNNGGAEFVFTSADKSVAVHTHGDLSNRGIIAAAIYEEDYYEPIRIDYYLGDSNHGESYNFSDNRIGARSRNKSDYLVKNTASIQNTMEFADCCNASPSQTQNSVFNISDTRNLESLVSVGAGQHIDQKIAYVTGLIKPKFAETVRVKYFWWDQLKEKLLNNDIVDGFPGDRKIMSIGNTPRLEKPLNVKCNDTQTIKKENFSRF